MPVAVVQIREMRMLVPHRFVPMDMRMCLRYRTMVGVLVMRVMNMHVFMFQHVMLVLVFMPLGQVQVQTQSHQSTCQRKCQGQWF